ncbi:putative secreted protein with PEP-CTERM sorting signal [Roseimicrobium gellanilyticum]|uniref:Putative secreted protein with PEP-CTERM sorting signal n=1 Tax=Roseimicrobium gellanilyticum TaxID=748857 RepID=A0A366HU48_9BACT|nr:autotransporter-associated beta strand repeat-containing protein [Roseimicrobium gellanilyticum]RBP47209.1 putative secreted protein with PEP-CTERM sorting signal [Roseimicrobium gellanilyticum]
MPSLRKLGGFMSLAGSLLFSITSVSTLTAQTNTYTGATSAWSVGTNWSLGEPTAAHDVVLPGVVPASGGTITLAAGELANSLSFLNSYTLTGGNLTLTTGNISVDPTFTGTISSVLQGSVGLAKDGNGILVLGGANTFTGTVNINAGTLSISNNNNLGAASNGINFTGSGTLDVTAAVTAGRAMFIDAGIVGTMNITTGVVFRIDGVVSGGGTLSKNTSGTLVLGNAANTLSVITSAGGNLLLESSGSLGDASTTVNINGGTIGADDSGINTYTVGTLNIGGNVQFGITASGFTGSQIFSGTAVDLGGAARTLTTDEDVVFTGIVSNGSIVKAGDDFLQFNNNQNSFNGLTFSNNSSVYLGGDDVLGSGIITWAVSDGRLRSNDGTARILTNNLVLNANAIFGAASTGNLTIGKVGGTVDFGTGTRTINVDSVTTTFLSAVVNGTGMSKSGSGTAVFLASNTITGNVSIGTGNITVRGSTGKLSTGTGVVTVGDNNGNDESLTIGDAGDSLSGTVDRLSDGTTLRFNGSTSATFNGPGNSITEVIDVLDFAAGVGILTLNPAVGGEIQLNVNNATASLTRSNNNAMGVIRGTGLGQTGANSTRVIFAVAPTMLGLGGTGANTSIIPYLIGGDSTTDAPDTFLTYDAVNGVKPLADSDYSATVTGSHGQNVSVGALAETITGDASINALRLTAGGSIAMNAGADVVLRSGALLSTTTTTISGPGTLTLGESLVNGTGQGRQGVIFASANATPILLTINANVGTAGGLIVGDAGSTGHTIVLGGDNKIIGGIVLNGGTLRAGSAGALNDNYFNDLVLRAGNSTTGGALSTTLQVFGNNISVIFGGNDRLQGSTRIQNGAATAGTITILANVGNSDGNDGVLENGSGGGVLNVAKRGAFRVQLESNNSYTGSTEIFSGELRVTGSGGRLSGTTSLNIRGGGSFYTYKQSDQNVDRVNDGAAVNMHQGSFLVDQNQSAFNLAETLGALNILNGDNTIQVEASVAAQTSTLTFASLNVSSGAVVNFTNAALAGDIGIGEADDNRVIFTADPAVTLGGIMGGNVYHTKNFNTGTTQDVVNFAGYDIDTDGTGTADVETGVYAFAAYNTGEENTWTSTTVANPTADVTLTASRTIEAIRLGGGIDITMSAGQVLNLTTGGLIHNGTDSSISGGTLTAGGSADGELFIRTEDNLNTTTLTISSVIADNGSGSVSLTKTGPDNLVLSGANTYTGRTTLSGGTVSFTADSAFGTAPTSATAGHLRLYGVTLAQTADTGTITIDGNRGLELGGTTNIISTAAGSNLVYNTMGITSNGDASLTLQGDIDMAIGGNTTIGGSFTIQDGGSVISLGGTTNSIGGSLIVGQAQGTTTFNYGVAGGTLIVGANSPNTSVLEVGTRTSGTLNTSTGILNLAGSDTFIANVDRVRIGVLTVDIFPDAGTRGVVTFGTNAHITAGTEVIMSDSQNDGLQGTPSTMTFGNGTSSLTSRTITVGARKGNATISIAAGGTLNLGGFGERMLDLFIARQLATQTGVTNSGTLDFSQGTLIASIDEFVIADKSGPTSVAGSGGAGGATGTVTLGNSAHNVVANSLTMARITQAASGALAQATYNQGGGSTIILGNILLGSHDDAANGAARGTLNITGGVFTVGGNIFKAGAARSSAVIIVNGGTLDLQNQAHGDTTAGTFTGSQLIFRAGSIVDGASVTLDGVRVTTATDVGSHEDALILRDVTLDVDVFLTNATAGLGGILYEANGNGAGGIINGDVDLGTVSRDINVGNSTGANADLTMAGRITNSGSINKQGTGTLVLSNGTNNYQGTTTVSAGVLQVGLAGVGTTGTGTTTVTTTGTLAGTGTVTGSAATHVIQGTLRPGDLSGAGIGNLKFEGNLTLESTATSFFQLGSPTTPGTTYDRITGLSANDTIIVDGTISAAELNDSFFGGYTGGAGDTWQLLMDWTTINLAGFNVGTNLRTGADGVNEGDLDLPTLSAGLFWDVSNFGNNGTVSIVPEPGRALLLLLGVAGLLMRRRRPGRLA